ncbi:MAG: hypothetical protein IPJ14_08780 [Kineosporiaceae bacterium]|nr:hypothetical protein [Kineosporiaceae bacterium]
MRTAQRVLVIAAATVCVGGCGGAAAPATVPSTGVSVSVPVASGPVRTSTPTPTPILPPSAARPTTAGDSHETEHNVITFKVEGGFSGQLRELTIEPDGAASATVSGRRSVGRVEAEQLAAIRRALEGSGLFGGDHTYPPGAGADLQIYTIGYQGATVVAYDTTVPASLTEAITALQQVLRQVQS